MKYIITESQHKRLFEEEQKVLHIHDVKVFGGWNNLKRYLELKGNPPYSIGGDLDLSFTSTRTLGNLQSVGGDLNLSNTDIQYLWKLKSVGGSLILKNTSVSSFGFFGDLTPIEDAIFMVMVPGFLLAILVLVKLPLARWKG